MGRSLHANTLGASVASVLTVAVLAVLGAPWWAVAVVAGGLAAGLVWLDIRRRRRLTIGTGALSSAMARLGAGSVDASAGAIDPENLSQRLDALADEVAARLDEAMEQAARTAAWLEAVPEPLLVVDDQDTIRVCNRSAAELLERPAERLVGRSVEDVFTQADLLRIIALARRSGTVRLHVSVPREGGAATWEVAAAGMQGREGAAIGGAVVLMLRDVTEQARALQVKTDFVANASHELRTPIAALRTAVETLMSLHEGDPPEVRERLMGVVAANIASLEEMARDLLDLSRVEAEEAEVRWREVEMEQVAESMRAMFEAACRERNVDLRFEIDPQAARIWTDLDLLNLILRNLIDNATRFAREGTAVRVRVRAIGASMEREAGVVIEVIDRGQGIPLSSQQRIFERYFQVDTARTAGAHRRGSGLGLAIVKHAVKRLGGTIRVHSIWQQGTTMTVELPGAVVE